jgi:hypothetical protein
MNDLSLAEISEEQRKPRGAGRPFQPGRSGNPGGRPKEVGHVRDLARQHTEQAIAALVEVMQTGKDSARAAAAAELLNRAWGKATQPIKQEASPVIQLSPADVKALGDGLLYMERRKMDEQEARRIVAAAEARERRT